jgi:hypothetical protein
VRRVILYLALAASDVLMAVQVCHKQPFSALPVLIFPRRIDDFSVCHESVIDEPCLAAGPPNLKVTNRMTFFDNVYQRATQ